MSVIQNLKNVFGKIFPTKEDCLITERQMKNTAHKKQKRENNPEFKKEEQAKNTEARRVKRNDQADEEDKDQKDAWNMYSKFQTDKPTPKMLHNASAASIILPYEDVFAAVELSYSQFFPPTRLYEILYTFQSANDLDFLSETDKHESRGLGRPNIVAVAFAESKDFIEYKFSGMLNWGEKEDLRILLKPKISKLLDALEQLKNCYFNLFLHVGKSGTNTVMRVMQDFKKDIPRATLAESIVLGCKRGKEDHRNHVPVNQSYLIVIELIIFYMKCLSGYRKGPMSERAVEKKWRRVFYSAYFWIYDEATFLVQNKLEVDEFVQKVCKHLVGEEDGFAYRSGEWPFARPSSTILDYYGPSRDGRRTTFVFPTDVHPEKQTQQEEGAAELHRCSGILGHMGNIAHFFLYGQLLPQIRAVLEEEEEDESEEEEEQF